MAGNAFGYASSRGQFVRRLFIQQLGHSFADRLVRIERWKKLPHVHPQDLPQIAKFAVADFEELRLKFGDTAAADVPAGKLQVQGKISL